MSRLHICNTFFERELSTSSSKSLTDWIRSHPILLQLQFLPLLYAAPEDRIAVTDLPDNPDPRLCLLDHPPNLPLETWGPSKAIATWAQKHRIPYDLPEWSAIQTINSKVFSFLQSPKLPHARLLQSQQEVDDWFQITPSPKVLKTPFGTAGNGHFLNVKPLYKPPFIGEPWVERILDFSTQWENGELLGVTLFENELDGTYKRTYAGPLETWALDEHLSIARPLIQKIAQMGYSGNIGIDAFIYLWEGKKRLHPIVEINARKTMSWVALQRSNEQLSYTHASQGLLPSSLSVNGKTIRFTRNIS